VVSVPMCGANNSSSFCYSQSNGGDGTTSDGGNAAEVRRATGVDPISTNPSTLCPIDSAGDFFIKLPCEIWAFISKTILTIVGGLVALTASLFDYVVKSFVLQISTLFLENYVDGAGVTKIGEDKPYIYAAWTVIRDLGNIIAFFGAVYTGFRYIIGKDDLDFKKSVMKLVFYSLMVNFSFPIAKFLIDISNVVSLQIYYGITGYNAGGGELKNLIMQRIGVQSLVGELTTLTGKFGQFNSFTVLWLTIIYMFLTFGVFIYASLQIIIRAFILIACVIFSPIMFLNFAFPKITELHEKWRENFFGQLFFMPLLMIGFWLSFTLLSATTAYDVSTLSEVSDASTTDTLLPIINMSLAIIALIMGIKLSSAASGSVGKYASGVVGGALKNVGLGVVTGGGGALARMSIGRMGTAMASSKWANVGKENGVLRRMSGTMLKNVGGKMSGYSAFGKDSYKVKTEKSVDKEKAEIKNTNFEQLKATGLSKTMDEAKTLDEVAKVRAEMEHRESNADEKTWSKDVLGRAEAKRQFNAEQERLKNIRVKGIAPSKVKEYEIETKTLEERRKSLAGIQSQKEANLTPAQSLEKQNLEAQIRAGEDKIKNELEGTSASFKFGTALGKNVGDARVGISSAKDNALDAVGATAVIQGTKRVIKNAGEAVVEFADRPSIISTVTQNTAKNYREKTTAYEREREMELQKREVDRLAKKAENSAPAKSDDTPAPTNNNPLKAAPNATDLAR
jgi:hypothetical protein